MWVFMCVCVVYVDMHWCVSVHVDLVCAWICTCVCVHSYVCVFVCMCVCVCMSVCACMRARVCVCVGAPGKRAKKRS